MLEKLSRSSNQALAASGRVSWNNLPHLYVVWQYEQFWTDFPRNGSSPLTNQQHQDLAAAVLEALPVIGFG
jgi:hypothetical protein